MFVESTMSFMQNIVEVNSPLPSRPCKGLRARPADFPPGMER